MMRTRATVKCIAAAAALTLLGTACFGRGNAQPAGSYRVDEVEGRAEVARAGAWTPLSDGDALAAGDRVRTASGAALGIVRAGAVEIALGPGSEALLGADRATVERGSVLGVAQDGSALALEAHGVSARTTGGAMRIDRGLSVRVGAYEGSVRLSSAAGETTVPWLREAVLVGGALPRSAEPLKVSALDRWDRRFLADALDLDRGLSSLARGFDAQYGSPGSASFFGRFVPLGSGTFVDPYLGSARGSDVLVGLVLAGLIRERDGRSLASAFSWSVDLRLQGASWGLVAHEQGLDPDLVLSSALRAANGHAGSLPGLGGTGSGSGGGSGGGSGSGGGGGGGSGGGGTTNPTPSPSPSPSVSPSPTEPPPPPPDPCEDPVYVLLNPQECLT